MDAIAQACDDGLIMATVGMVISDRPDAGGLAIAKQRNIPTWVCPPKDFSGKIEHENAMVAMLKRSNIDLIILAGHMNILGKTMLDAYPDALNIHPSLLPQFKGLNAQQQALDAHVAYSGCTVHYVTSRLDSGPIIDQMVVPVLPNDTEATLGERILKQEHLLYPRAIQKVIRRLNY